MRNLAIALALLGVSVVFLRYITGADSIQSLLIAVALFVGEVTWGSAISRAVFVIVAVLIVLFIPVLLRRRLKIRWRFWRMRIRHSLLYVSERGWLMWNSLPLFVRAVIVMGTAMLAGSTLWLIAFLLPFLAKTAFGIVVIRYLAQTAAARSVRGLTPYAWRLLPRPLRSVAEREYRRLWWRTTRRAIRERKARELLIAKHREERRQKKIAP